MKRETVPPCPSRSSVQACGRFVEAVFNAAGLWLSLSKTRVGFSSDGPKGRVLTESDSI